MDSTLLAAFEAQTKADPGFPLIERGHSIWTRAQISALSRRLAESAPTLRENAVVCLKCANGPEFLAALVGLKRLGATVLLVDAATPPVEVERLGLTFGCGASLVNTDPCSSVAWSWTVLPRTPVTEATEAAVASAQTTVIKLTSGSTGGPRGVMVTEAALLADEAALYASMQLGQERVLTTIPLSHSYGLSSIALAALLRDMTIVMPISDSPVDALKTLRTANVTFFPSVPAWLQAMVGLGAPQSNASPQSNTPSQIEASSQRAPLGTVRLVISAGAPLLQETARRFHARFGLPIKTFYGASECGGIAFDRTGAAGLDGALGTAVEGVTLELDHSVHNGAPIGQVRVTSEALASGYLHAAAQPDQTTSFEHFASGFLSSDLATLDGGLLRLQGRSDDVLNLKGKKLHPSEVERVLTSFDRVQDAYVFAESKANRPNSLHLKALIVGPASLDRATILSHCRDNLAEYKVPRSITVVAELPRTERGKLDRAAARRLCEAKEH